MIQVLLVVKKVCIACLLGAQLVARSLTPTRIRNNTVFCHFSAISGKGGFRSLAEVRLLLGCLSITHSRISTLQGEEVGAKASQLCLLDHRLTNRRRHFSTG